MGRSESEIFCRFQFKAGGELPCCQLKWLMVLNDPQFAGKALEKHTDFGENNNNPPTACIFGTMGRYCYGEDD